MREVDESLELMKKDHKKRMDECEDRRVQFEAKQGKMREQVLKFEKFIQENDAKRQRAEAKAKLERKLFDEKARELNNLVQKIAKLEQEVKQLNDELGKKSCYKLYLERIVEEGEYGYEEISEILNRHFTLTQANNDLIGHSEKLDKEVDELRRNLQNLKTEKQNQLLVSTSILQGLQSELEKIRSQAKIQEDENLQRENKKKDISREFTQIIQAIRNLYGRCHSTMTVKTLFNIVKENSSNPMESADLELDLILTRMVDLIEITNEYKQDCMTGGDSSLFTGSSSLINMSESKDRVDSNTNNFGGSKSLNTTSEKKR